ncbi:MAG: TAT-variant-translocated molybdopterin oxidoreductase [Myxococcota bacterium]
MNKSRKTPRFWRSLNELEHNEEFSQFMKGEFPETVDTPPDSASRRQFVQLMGASFALAGGTSACRWPREEIRPYTRRPEGLIPGEEKTFATAMELSGVAGGLSVLSFDGRPIKVEGNEKHPTSRGKTTTLQQAAILELYDPDRSHTPSKKGGAPASLEEFRTWATSHFKGDGTKVAFLMEASSSPTRARLLAKLAEKMPKASVHVYEPVNRDNELRGSQIAFGKTQRTHADLSSAKVILSLSTPTCSSCTRTGFPCPEAGPRTAIPRPAT